jgi:hypothetical protein
VRLPPIELVVLAPGVEMGFKPAHEDVGLLDGQGEGEVDRWNEVVTHESDGSGPSS